jgi:peptidoglycan/LPS O-acetylase OafA/YrhL
VVGEGRPGTIPHISALDGARGLAIAGVVAFHGGHLRGGYLGVDFFFTLSGFLITSLLLTESARTGSVGLGGFWARRARRLLPALAVLLVGVAVYSVVWAKPTELGQIRGDALATLGYVANWHDVFAHTSYFALFGAPSPLAHTWSLAIEEQFYLLWPLLFVALLARFTRDTAKAVLVVSIVLAAASAILMVTLYDPANTNRVYYGTDTRAAAILLGAALAAALSAYGPVTGRRRRVTLEAVAGVGAAILVVAWTRLDGQSSTLYHGGFLVCGLAATVVIAAAVHPERGPIARALSFAPLCALGLISYGVYLYHWPIDVILDTERVGLRGWPLLLLQTAVTLIIAAASYHFIEQPIRHGALTAARLRRLTPAIAAGLVVVVIVSTSGGQPSARLQLPTHPIEAATRAFLATPPGSRRVMFVGNSVAAFLGLGMQTTSSDPAVEVFNASVLGCAFPPAIPAYLARGGLVVDRAPRCDPSWEAQALQRFRPNVVFWIWADPGGGYFRAPHREPCTEPFDSIFQKSLKREIARLRASGAKVVVTTEAYVRAPGTANTDRATDCENRTVREVGKAAGAQVDDLFDYVCPHGRCIDTKNGVTLRPDGLHYEGAGARLVARWLLDSVRSR